MLKPGACEMSCCKCCQKMMVVAVSVSKSHPDKPGFRSRPASRCQKALSTQNVLQPVKAGSGVERLQSENVAPISMAVPSDDWRGSEIDTQHDPGSPGGILLRLVRLII